jgi:hypothetical protein
MAQKMSVGDFVYGVSIGFVICALIWFFLGDRSSPSVPTELPEPVHQKAPHYAYDDEVEVRFSLWLPSERRCWTAVTLSRTDLPFIHDHLLEAARREGVEWKEVARCPPDHEGGCSHSTTEPISITTVYAYDTGDAGSLRRACLKDATSGWVGRAF